MKDTYWIINPATGKASLTGYSSLNPIQTTPAGTETDFESVACYSDDLAISATDNAVTALKGSVGDLVWSDFNGDGNFDPAYTIIGGRIDIQNDGGEGGVINGNDDGVIGSIAVINGYLDLDGDGVTDGDDGDDGTFQGHMVVNGVLSDRRLGGGRAGHSECPAFMWIPTMTGCWIGPTPTAMVHGMPGKANAGSIPMPTAVRHLRDGFRHVHGAL